MCRAEDAYFNEKCCQCDDASLHSVGGLFRVGLKFRYHFLAARRLAVLARLAALSFLVNTSAVLVRVQSSPVASRRSFVISSALKDAAEAKEPVRGTVT